MDNPPLRLMCRKTRKPATMRIGVDTCPHCGATSHGADLTDLNAEVAKLTRPLPPPATAQG